MLDALARGTASATFAAADKAEKSGDKGYLQEHDGGTVRVDGGRRMSLNVLDHLLRYGPGKSGEELIELPLPPRLGRRKPRRPLGVSRPARGLCTLDSRASDQRVSFRRSHRAPEIIRSHRAPLRGMWRENDGRVADGREMSRGGAMGVGLVD